MLSWKVFRARSGVRLRNSREFPVLILLVSPLMEFLLILTWLGFVFSLFIFDLWICVFVLAEVLLFFYWNCGFCIGSRFVWDDAKYPTMSPLKEIVDGIHSQVAKIEDDLKVFSFSSQSLVLVRFDLYVWFHGCDNNIICICHSFPYLYY